MALQQHCDVGTVPTQQTRDMELAQAWQDLASILIIIVSSWPPFAVDSGKILRCFQDVGERLEERLRQEGGWPVPALEPTVQVWVTGVFGK